MSTNQLREQLVQELTAYYNDVGVNPFNFHCPHKDKCPGNDLARGMECHIGLKYGQKKKILVSSLDNGNGGSSDIKQRSENVHAHHAGDEHRRHQGQTENRAGSGESRHPAQGVPYH